MYEISSASTALPLMWDASDHEYEQNKLKLILIKINLLTFLKKTDDNL